MPRKIFDMRLLMLAAWFMLYAGTVKAQSAACIVGSHVGFPDADVLTATRLICAELRKQGVAVSEPEAVNQNNMSGYRVELSRLGSLVFVRLAKVEQGKVADSRETNITRIEDVPDAAPRLAQALIQHTSVATTQRNDNILSNEAKDPKAVPARFMFGLGIGGAALISKDVRSAYGIELNFHRQMPRWSMGLSGRIMGSSNAILMALNIGGRYYFSDTNITPFAGASIGLYGLGNPETPTGGLGGQLEIGVEAMRFTKRSRLGFAVRVDLPFFTANFEQVNTYPQPSVKTSEYLVPVGLYAYYFF